MYAHTVMPFPAVPKTTTRNPRRTPKYRASPAW